METGYSPTNTSYALLNLSYDNPKKKLYVGLDAAYIKSNIDIKYVNANVNKDFKNDSVTRERYRREQLNMKKENEDLFLIKE